MREIKFRAFLKSNKLMYDVLTVDIIDSKVLIENKENQLRGYVKYSEIELMQYTGLKDKNGKEIYEGDIIQIPDNYDEYGLNAGEIYQVYFAYGGFRLKPKYQPNARGMWLEDDGEFEVIGNIHENPELLEENR